MSPKRLWECDPRNTFIDMTTNTTDPVARALSAWYRQEGFQQPSSDSGLVEHNGKEYVVLRNVTGVLGVFRIRPNGALKRLKRWPAALEEG